MRDISETAMEAAIDAVASSPVKAVYEDAGRIAPAAVRAYLRALDIENESGPAEARPPRPERAS